MTETLYAYSPVVVFKDADQQLESWQVSSFLLAASSKEDADRRAEFLIRDLLGKSGTIQEVNADGVALRNLS